MPGNDQGKYEAAINRIISILKGCMEEEGIDTASLQRFEKPSGQCAESGLFLEMRNGSPWSIFTPMGEVGLTMPTLPRVAVGELMRRLAWVVQTPAKREGLGTIGPLYAVSVVDGIELPEPRLTRRSA